MGRQFLIVEKMIRLKRVGGKGGESFKNSNLNIRRKNKHTKKLRGGGVMGEVQVAGHQPVGRVRRSVLVCTAGVSAVWTRRRGIGAS